MVSTADILNASILIVDDQEANVQLLEEMLREAGYACIASTIDPYAVCELHRKNRYDLILLDLQMPGMDGFQVMEGLKEIETDGYVPILVITAQPGHKRRALASGAKDFIAKPLDLVEVQTRIHNMLEVRLLYKQLEHYNQMLGQTVAERTWQLEAFSYSVSHELRTPLRSIDGFSEILEKKYAERLDDAGRDYLGRVRRASKRMGELIDDLLLARVTRAELREEPVDLSQMVQIIASEMQEAAPQRQIEWVIQDGIVAQADSRLIKVVLENLLSNAWKFTAHQAAPRIEFGMVEREDEKVIFIRDNGAGFDIQYASKLFGAFQRLHKAGEFEGTGVGLATVQRIIHRHGGRVWAEGQTGAGATFYFAI